MAVTGRPTVARNLHDPRGDSSTVTRGCPHRADDAAGPEMGSAWPQNGIDLISIRGSSSRTAFPSGRVCKEVFEEIRNEIVCREETVINIASYALPASAPDRIRQQPRPDEIDRPDPVDRRRRRSRMTAGS